MFSIYMDFYIHMNFVYITYIYIIYIYILITISLPKPALFFQKKTRLSPTFRRCAKVLQHFHLDFRQGLTLPISTGRRSDGSFFNRGKFHRSFAFFYVWKKTKKSLERWWEKVGFWRESNSFVRVFFLRVFYYWVFSQHKMFGKSGLVVSSWSISAITYSDVGTLPKTNIFAPEEWWLGDYFLLGPGLFSGAVLVFGMY